MIKDKKVFCSSATGAMNMPLQQLVPDIDIRKDVAMAILPGTPMMPNKPTMVIWYRNPLLNDSGVFTSLNINLTPYLLYTTRQDDFNGIALIVGNTALSTFSSRLLTVAELPARHHDRQLSTACRLKYSFMPIAGPTMTCGMR
ncbi:rtn protein [Salmonella enterica subsp. enterica]|uniref:Rtn protein n=1 Tax=Salmonella enterica I TaxID=59201 RepID=A0A379W756_SALET|nr:rtn protein [Salmonella enterica subsp. enterica]